MKRRIFGLENEYGLTCTLNGQRRLSPDNVARYLFEKVIPGARNANVFLENGARLYLDTGFHPEYATPECDDVAELVIHDRKIVVAHLAGAGRVIDGRCRSAHVLQDFLVAVHRRPRQIFLR